MRQSKSFIHNRHFTKFVFGLGNEIKITPPISRGAAVNVNYSYRLPGMKSLSCGSFYMTGTETYQTELQHRCCWLNFRAICSDVIHSVYCVVSKAANVKLNEKMPKVDLSKVWAYFIWISEI